MWRAASGSCERPIRRTANSTSLSASSGATGRSIRRRSNSRIRARSAHPSGPRALHQERRRRRKAGEAATPKTETEKIAAWHGWKDLSGDLIVENNVHSIDVLNWFLGGHPMSAIGPGGRTLPGQGDMRDHNFVAFEYGNGVQGQLVRHDACVARLSRCRRAVLRRKGHDRDVGEPLAALSRCRAQETIEKSPRNITIDSVAAFVSRIARRQAGEHRCSRSGEHVDGDPRTHGDGSAPRGDLGRNDEV